MQIKNRLGAPKLRARRRSRGTGGFEAVARRACGGGIPLTAAGINYVRGLTWTIDFYSRCDWLNLYRPSDYGEY